MIPLTATALGTLDTHESDGLHRIVSITLHDPAAPPGDGAYSYWMFPGEIYGLVHDGQSWTVSGGSWVQAGRTYRMMRGDWPVITLPTTHGDEPLDEQCAYQILAGPDSTWELWRLNA